jgi:hypothetical protein
MMVGRLFLSVAAICLLSDAAAGQHMIELRGADTEYRYADWNYTFSNAAIIDLFYVGVPGSNEFNLGGGRAFKIGGLTLSPLLYAVLGKEEGQRGVKLALLAAYAKSGWTLNAFVGHYIPVTGAVSSYQVLVTLDFTRALDKRWELGVSGGFFHASHTWNPQIGPLLRINDRLGSWAVSYRFGTEDEFRVGRIFLLLK